MSSARDMSISVGEDGLAVISYYDANAEDPRFAHCDSPFCIGIDTTVIDAPGDVGEFSAVTIGVDGMPLASCYDRTNGNLKVAHMSNVFGIPWHRRR